VLSTRVRRIRERRTTISYDRASVLERYRRFMKPRNLQSIISNHGPTVRCRHVRPRYSTAVLCSGHACGPELPWHRDWRSFRCGYNLPTMTISVLSPLLAAMLAITAGSGSRSPSRSTVTFRRTANTLCSPVQQQCCFRLATLLNHTIHGAF
jgi:hypothetical protein